FVAASVAFDVESLAPTYQLRVGVPGSSYALRIAQRLGLASEVVSDAEELLAGTASLDRESLIERLGVEFQRVAEEREELAETREELARRSAKFEEKRQRMIDRDRKMVDKEAGKLKAELDGVRSQLRRIAREVRDFEGPSSASELGDKRRAVDQLRAELADAERAVSSARSVVSPDTNDELPTLTEEDFVVGTRVYVPSFKRSGEIVEVARGRAVVQVGPMRANVAREDLRATAQASEQVAPTATLSLDAARGEAIETTLDLRGERVDEAIEKLEAYIDRAASAQLPALYIVHGHGTGALKRAVRDHLRQSLHKPKYRPGERGEGGDGVTVVHW
ncbi:MAG: DNA mismatch repair protein MutS2, partial [Flavobacteriales bacterium]